VLTLWSRPFVFPSKDGRTQRGLVRAARNFRHRRGLYNLLSATLGCHWSCQDEGWEDKGRNREPGGWNRTTVTRRAEAGAERGGEVARNHRRVRMSVQEGRGSEKRAKCRKGGRINNRSERITFAVGKRERKSVR
jgi:hypothetical protein